MNENKLNANYIECACGEYAANFKEKIDVAFLDIEIGSMSGIDVAKSLQQKNKSIVIFIITAYDKYLDEAMDLNIFRFIGKPINPERIFCGLQKAFKIIDNTVIGFYLKSDDKYIQISINDIVYVEIEGRKTKIVTYNNTYYSNQSIKFWKSKLIQTFFYQVHTSFIINMNCISNYKREEVMLLEKYYIPVAYRSRADFKRTFMSYIENR